MAQARPQRVLWRGASEDDFRILNFFVRPTHAEIPGCEVAERPGKEEIPPLKIPAWLSLDLPGGRISGRV